MFKFMARNTALVLIATFALTQTAFAETDVTAAELATYEDTLADILTTEELAADVGVPESPEVGFAFTDRLTINVDKAERGMSPTAQTMQVYLDGQMILNFFVSTGREKAETAKSGKRTFTTTPPGTFRIQWRSKNHVSSVWNAPMPYAQFFNGGIAIHATTPSHYDELGSRASGGCVRLHLDAAKEMWNLVSEVGTDNVLINVIDRSI
ncbi:MAG TPA: L,D-transpeptidase [Bdellovibrionales bacterium]|nr:L,D-transpeptidase [Bdellovibrionales bacterium]